jgi:hypothetical protein
MADPSLMSATEIVAAIRDKKISATDVAKAAIARAEQVKDLNALIILNKDPALAAAAEIEAMAVRNAVMTTPTWWSQSVTHAIRLAPWAASSQMWRCWIPSLPAHQWPKRSHCATSASASRRFSGTDLIGTSKP